MRNKLTKVALTASILLALAFTISCSDDDKEVVWLTCDQAIALFDSCDKKYQPEYDACNTADDFEICLENVEKKADKCIMDDACNGTDEDECWTHYEHCFEE